MLSVISVRVIAIRTIIDRGRLAAELLIARTGLQWISINSDTMPNYVEVTFGNEAELEKTQKLLSMDRISLYPIENRKLCYAVIKRDYTKVLMMQPLVPALPGPAHASQTIGEKGDAMAWGSRLLKKVPFLNRGKS